MLIVLQTGVTGHFDENTSSSQPSRDLLPMCMYSSDDSPSKSDSGCSSDFISPSQKELYYFKVPDILFQG